MLAFLERLFSRGPKAAGEKSKAPPPGQPRHEARTAADQDRDDFEAESERLRSSDRMIPPGGV